MTSEMAGLMWPPAGWKGVLLQNRRLYRGVEARKSVAVEINGIDGLPEKEAAK